MPDENLSDKPIITIARARALGLARYNGKPCKYGHGTERSIWNNNCIVCLRKAKAEIYKKERERRPQRSTPDITVLAKRRLLSNINITSGGCWEWIGARTGRGYGAVGLLGKQYSTHRLSWEVYNGSIPPGLYVLHHCDNPPCFRPDHLFLGDGAANMTDKMAKGRHSRGLAPTGERHPFAKLTWDDVGEIRRLHALGKSNRALAELFQIDDSQISRIINNSLWKLK